MLRTGLFNVMASFILVASLVACGSSSATTKNEANNAPVGEEAPKAAASSTEVSGLGGSFISNRGSGSSAKCGMEGARVADNLKSCIRSQHDGIRDCYQKAMVGDDELTGQIRVKFTIGADGSTGDVGLVTSTVNDGDFERCVLSQVEAWMFPAGDGDLAIIYPFKFRPAADN